MSQPLLVKFGLSVVRMVLSAGSGLAVSIIVARSLGASAMGTYTFMVWVAGTIAALALAGLPDAISKFVAHHRSLGNDIFAGQFARTILTGQFLIALAATIVGGAAWIFLQPSQATLVLLALATVLPAVMQQTLFAFLEGEQRFDLQALLTLCGLLVQIVTVGAISLVRPTISGFLIANIFSVVVLCGMTVFAAWRATGGSQLGGDHERPQGMIREILAFSLPVYTLWILNLIVFDKSEFLFLRHYGRSEEVAFYGIAFALTARLATLGESLVYVLFPTFVTTHAQSGRDALGILHRRSIRLIQIFTFPLCAWALPLLPRLVIWAYGDQFRRIVPVLQILLVSTIFSVLMTISSSAIYAVDHQRAILRWMIPVALLNVALDFLLIPRFAAFGAAIANGVAQSIASIGVILLLHRLLPSSYSFVESVKIAVLSILSVLPLVVVVWFYGDNAISLILTIVATPFMYALLLKAAHLLTPEEEQLLERMWRGLFIRKAN